MLIVHEKYIEYYNGFEIVHYTHGIFRTYYYRVKKDGKKFSEMAMNSPLACRNVIDTWLRSLNPLVTKLYLNQSM